MKRLLWKEWYETRAFLLGLLVIPWLFAIVKWTEFGYRISDRTDLPVMDAGLLVCALLTMAWGATRMSSELGTERITTRWLPIERYKVLSAKFIPGLVVSIAIPLWMHFLAVQIVYPRLEHSFDLSYVPLWENTAYFVMAYCSGFLLGSFMVPTAAVVIGSIFSLTGLFPMIVLAGIDYAYSLSGLSVDMMGDKRLPIYCLFALAVFAGSLLICMTGRNSSVAKRSITGVLTTLLVFSVLQFIVPGRAITGISKENDFPSGAWPVFGQFGATEPVFDQAHKRVAYAVDKGGKCVVKAVDRRSERIIIDDTPAKPIAWLANGGLLLETLKEGRVATLDIWSAESGVVKDIAEFPAKGLDTFPITCIRMNAGESKAALYVLPQHGEGADLWVVDIPDGKRKLLLPGLDVFAVYDSDSHPDVVWDRNRIVFVRRDGTLWSIQDDGRGYHRILRKSTEEMVSAK